MNTLDVLGKAYSDPQILIGVFPADKLPDVKLLPAALIANLDTSNSQGSHCVALYFRKTVVANISTVTVENRHVIF